MFSVLTNILIFFIFAFILIFEAVLSFVLHIDKALFFIITIGIYLIFIIYQIILFLYYYFELNKTKEILNEITDSIKGIPIINKDDKIIIKWDIIFKDLTENKEFVLYDKIVKFKTKKISSYINKHPSILFDNTFMKEFIYNKDLKSFITRDGLKDKEIDLGLDNEELSKRLFISDISENKLALTNYDSSIIIDIVLIHEYEPINSSKNDSEANPFYEGFSVNMYYKKKKYTIVPRIMLYGKKINKSKWFIDNINLFLKSATELIKGSSIVKYELNESTLNDYIEDIPITSQVYKPFISFHSMKNKILTFKNIDFEKEAVTYICNLIIERNSFEIMLDTVEKKRENDIETIDVSKTVAVGTSFDPILTIFENLPQIIINIELVVSKKQLKNIVF